MIYDSKNIQKKMFEYLTINNYLFLKLRKQMIRNLKNILIMIKDQKKLIKKIYLIQLMIRFVYFFSFIKEYYNQIIIKKCKLFLMNH